MREGDKFRTNVRATNGQRIHIDSKTTREEGDKVVRQCTAVLQPGFFLSNTFKEVPSMRQAQAQDDISDSSTGA